MLLAPPVDCAGPPDAVPVGEPEPEPEPAVPVGTEPPVAEAIVVARVVAFPVPEGLRVPVAVEPEAVAVVGMSVETLTPAPLHVSANASSAASVLSPHIFAILLVISFSLHTAGRSEGVLYVLMAPSMQAGGLAAAKEVSAVKTTARMVLDSILCCRFGWKYERCGGKIGKGCG